MKGRNTVVIATRIPDALHGKVAVKAMGKGLTPSAWLKRLIEKELGIRPRI